MRINQVASVQNNQSFGRIRLGRGGARRLAESMPVVDARIMISRNFMSESDIIISKEAVEVIPPEKDRIYKISDVVAGGNGFTDIEVFEHGMRNIFRINGSLVLSAYGAKNKQISLAEAVAKEMNRNPYHWKECLRTDDSKEDVSGNLEKTIQALEKYNAEYGMF